MSKHRRRVPRECVACKAPQPPVYGIPDPCLGMLPGVLNACCGHGNKWHCYLHFEDDSVIREDEARERQIKLGGNPALFDRNLMGPLESGWRPT